MSVDVALVLRTQLQMSTFLSIANKLLGYSPAAKADAVNPKLKEIPHELLTMLGFKDKDASPSLEQTEQLHDMYTFGFLVGADERDLPAILEACKMPYVLQDTTLRGFQVALIVGTFRQWQDAIKRCCKQDVDQTIRVCFDKIYLIFEREGLAKALQVGRLHRMPDTTFYLEDRRG